LSETPVEVNPFDLTNQVETDGFLSGYIAVVKVIREDGSLYVELVAHDMNNYESVGVLTEVLDKIRAANAAESWDEEEDED
jgi:hypothetical protein